MTLKKLSTLSAVCLLATTGLASADTIYETKIIEQVEREGVKQINFSELDVNGDKILSRQEVGERLFKAFDRDNNQLIDNNEWTMKSVYTIVPVEQEIYRFYDEDDDGVIENYSYVMSTFMDETGLSRFDAANDGLTPKEFIQENFQSLDDSDNGLIEMSEWEEGYARYVQPEVSQNERYNN